MTATGEFERIELFIDAFRRAGGAVSSAEVPLGPGDDAAILQSRFPLAITTDALVEDVHFRRDWSTWEQVGWKALAVNLSDLAAMGARPFSFTCAIAHPPDFEADALAALARGMGRLAEGHGAVLAGGNFTRAKEVSVTITALGAQERTILRRDRARAGDAILLIGEVGVAAAELSWLQADRALPAGRSAQLEPIPLISAGIAAAALAECGIDVSDGLAQDLGHIARASRVCVRIDAAKLPRSERFQLLTADLEEPERARLQLAGGEDYALVVTAPATIASALRDDLGGVEIGVITPGEGVEISNMPAGVALGGHDHFVERR